MPTQKQKPPPGSPTPVSALRNTCQNIWQSWNSKSLRHSSMKPSMLYHYPLPLCRNPSLAFQLNLWPQHCPHYSTTVVWKDWPIPKPKTLCFSHCQAALHQNPCSLPPFPQNYPFPWSKCGGHWPPHSPHSQRVGEVFQGRTMFPLQAEREFCSKLPGKYFCTSSPHSLHYVTPHLKGGSNGKFSHDRGYDWWRNMSHRKTLSSTPRHHGNLQQGFLERGTILI